MAQISARIKDELSAELQKVAQKTERTITYHLEKAIELYLGEYADLQIALDRLNDPTDKTISFEEMEQKIGLRD